MAKGGGTQLETCPLLISVEVSEDFGGIFFDALGNHHDCMGLAALVCGAQSLRDLACRYFELGRRNDFRAAGDAGHRRQIAAVPPHCLDQKCAIVRGTGRAQVVDRLKSDIDGGVAADGDISPEQIVVDGRCDADNVNAELAEHIRARLRSVAADHHQTVDAPLGEVAKRFGPAALLTEFHGASAAKECAADLNDAAHVARTEQSELTIDQPLPTLTDAVDRHALIERAARDGAYGCIHAGRIAAARKDRDMLHKFETMTVCPGSPPQLCSFLVRNQRPKFADLRTLPLRWRTTGSVRSYASSSVSSCTNASRAL